MAVFLLSQMSNIQVNVSIEHFCCSEHQGAVFARLHVSSNFFMIPFDSGMYDGSEHIPKLMPCSHTVCLHCLDRIVATFARDTGQFRCPICRELITIPRGGVCNLPPSFLVNQLLDLMAR